MRVIRLRTFAVTLHGCLNQRRLFLNVLIFKSPTIVPSPPPPPPHPLRHVLLTQMYYLYVKIETFQSGFPLQ